MTLAKIQVRGIFRIRDIRTNVFPKLIDGFHGDVIRLHSQKNEVLRILIYTRLKINRKSLYKFPAAKHVSFRKYSSLNFRVFTARDTKRGMLSR